MKRKIYNKNVKIVSFLLVLLIFFTAQANALDISFLIGDVKIKRSSKKIKASTKIELKNGDIIQTGKRSLAVLTNNQGTRIEIKELSQLLIDKKIIETGSASLIRGSIIAKYQKVKKGRQRKIYTPTSVCAIRGTGFSVTVSNSGQSRVKMKEGKLNVSNPSGKTKISGKQSAEITPGKTPARSLDKSGNSAWKEKNDKNFAANPGQAGNNLKKHVVLLDKSTGRDSKQIAALNKSVSSANSKFALKQSGKKLAKTERSAADNYMLNRSTSLSLDNILNEQKDKKSEIFTTFSQIKADSNRVLEQQKRNLEEINKIREAYKKAYKEIMDKHNASVKDILDKSKTTE